ncbi:MAG: hypothetical protein M0017_04465 [Desulfobacteraceae bacterium]|nr:hypothetical protein [Desulfobacteraceae bacterium]
MRKYPTAVGIVSLSLFLAAGVAVLAITARNSSLDHEGRQFVSAAIPAIFTHWDERALISRATTDLRAAVKDRELNGLFEGMSRQLGPLKGCKGIEGGASISVEPDRGIVESGEYLVRTRFAAGDADIRLSLVKDNNNWRILSFRLDSDQF